MTLSSLPFLFATQCAFLLLAARKADLQPAVPIALIGLLAGWGATSVFLAMRGIYLNPTFLDLLPGFWLPLVPLILIAVAICVISIRQTLYKLALRVPMAWFAGIQILRIAALGTLFKTIKGEFPIHVELAIGIVDLLFGLSAVLVYSLCKSQKISSDGLMVWHITGIVIVAIPGIFAIQAGLPGPLQLFSDPPTAEIMLQYPMVLGPSLVVPVFFLLNALGAWAAFLQRR